MVKNMSANADNVGSIRLSQKDPWQPAPVFLPGKFHGQRSLASYTPWGLKTLRHDLTTKQQQTVRVYMYTYICVCVYLGKIQLYLLLAISNTFYF